MVILSGGEAGARDRTSARQFDAVEGNVPEARSDDDLDCSSRVADFCTVAGWYADWFPYFTFFKIAICPA